MERRPKRERVPSLTRAMIERARARPGRPDRHAAPGRRSDRRLAGADARLGAGGAGAALAVRLWLVDVAARARLRRGAARHRAWLASPLLPLAMALSRQPRAARSDARARPWRCLPRHGLPGGRARAAGEDRGRVAAGDDRGRLPAPLGYGRDPAGASRRRDLRREPAGRALCRSATGRRDRPLHRRCLRPCRPQRRVSPRDGLPL